MNSLQTAEQVKLQTISTLRDLLSYHENEVIKIRMSISLLDGTVSELHAEPLLKMPIVVSHTYPELDNTFASEPAKVDVPKSAKEPSVNVLKCDLRYFLDNCAKYRHAQTLTIPQIAKEIRHDKTLIYKIEKGGKVSMNFVKALSNFYNVEINDDLVRNAVTKQRYENREVTDKPDDEGA